MYTREKKTAHELADMVANGIGVRGVAVVVHKDSAYGWHRRSTPSCAQNRLLRNCGSGSCWPIS
jgi:hypothetical protein